MEQRRLTTFFSFIPACISCLVLAGCLDAVEDGDNQAQDSGGDQISSNSAPTIGGTPATGITIGHIYTFVPNASDADGDRLTFSINNLPDWATFNSSTGELSGQPHLGAEGIYSDIAISVTDGNTTVAMASFSITVTQSSLGTATLSLQAPTLNTDGTPFTDLRSYRLYFGTSQGVYPNQIVIDSAGVSEYVVENLAPATYYFVATVTNSSGFESGYSNEVSRVVN